MPLQCDVRHYDQVATMHKAVIDTSKESKWKSCAPPTGDETNVCYYSFLVATDVEPWQYQELYWNRWLTNLHECEWAGVTCRDDRVTHLRLGMLRSFKRMYMNLESLNNRFLRLQMAITYLDRYQ